MHAENSRRGVVSQRSPVARPWLVVFYIFTLASAAAPRAYAGAPNLLTYQGRLQESSVPVTGTRSVEIKLCNNPSGPTCFTTGVQGVSVANGLFRSTFTVPGSVDLGAGSWYLQVNVNGTDLNPREQLSSTPYAMHASSAAGVAAANVAPGTLGTGVILPAAQIGAGSLGTGVVVNVAPGSIDTAKINADAVTTNAILNGSVTSEKLGFPLLYNRQGSGTFSNGDYLEFDGRAIAIDHNTNAPEIAVSNPLASGFANVHIQDSRIYGFGPAYVQTQPWLKAGTFVFEHNNTGPLELVTLGAQSLDFYTNSSQRMTVAANGNVGIGVLLPATMLDVNGNAQFGSGSTKSTFTAQGYLIMAQGSSITLSGAGITLNGPNAVIQSASSITAGAFFGNGSGLTGVTASDASKVAKAGDTMTGSLTVVNSSVNIVGNGFLDVDGTARFGSGSSKSTFTAQGYLTMAQGSSITLTGAGITLNGSNGVIQSGSSITASAFFGNGSGLTGISASDASKVAKSGDVMTGSLEVSSINVNGAGLIGNATAFSVIGGTFSVRNNGRVGIGTGNPQARLDIKGGPNGDKDILLEDDGHIRWGTPFNGPSLDGNQTQGLFLGGPGPDLRIALNGDVSVGGNTGPARLYVSSSNATASQNVLAVTSGTGVAQELLVVKGDGKVGIGMNNPSFRFDVLGPLRADGGAFPSRIMGTPANAVLELWAHPTDTNKQFMFWVPNDNRLRLDRDNGAGEIVSFWDNGAVTTPGHLGIGTMNPTAALHVSSFPATGSAPVAIIASGTAAGQELLLVQRDGNVGIGTSNPTERLVVIGTVAASYFSGNGAGLTGITASGAVAKTGDSMTGALTIVNSSLTLTGTGFVDVNGTAQFGSGSTKSTFTPQGYLMMAAGSSITLTGAGITLNGSNGVIQSASSITAGAFFGDGSGLTGIAVTAGSIDTTKLATDAVTTPKIADGAVTSTKLANSISIGQVSVSTLGTAGSFGLNLNGVVISTNVLFNTVAGGDSYIAYPFLSASSIGARKVVVKTPVANQVDTTSVVSSNTVVGITVTAAGAGQTIFVAFQGIVKDVACVGTIAVSERVVTSGTLGAVQGAGQTGSHSAQVGRAMTSCSGGLVTVLVQTE